MLSEIQPSQYPAILPLFAPLDFNLVIRSVVAGNTPAWVYANDPAAPRAALIWDRQDAILVAGEASAAAQAAAREIILERITANARERGIPEFALLCTPAWEAAIPEILPELSPNPANRYSYRLNPPDFRPPQKDEAHFGLTRIDEDLLKVNLRQMDEMRGWIDSFWRTPQHFLQTGYGYCAILGDDIAAWCLTVFAAGDARELGVATVPGFRRRGMASQVAAACVQHGLDNQHAMHWHCWASNLPSALIADRLGFHVEREYTIYRLRL